MIENKEHIIDVQPIRSLEDIENMKWSLKHFCTERDYIIFLIGINTGLRVSDLLNLKTNDILKLRRKKQKELVILEGKTKKKRVLNLNNIYDEILQYAQGLTSEWLFPSRKGEKAVSKIQVYRALNKGALMVDIEHIGTHTMRKTFGYWFYKQTHDIAMLQTILNHSTPQITLRYIGITQEQTQNSLNDFRL